jgi:hypothetical protein
MEVDQVGDPAIVAGSPAEGQAAEGRMRRRMMRAVAAASAKPKLSRATRSVGNEEAPNEAGGAVAGSPAETRASLRRESDWNQPPPVSRAKSF